MKEFPGMDHRPGKVTYLSSGELADAAAYATACRRAADCLAATPTDVPGLWNVPGYPRELTSNQLLDIASRT